MRAIERACEIVGGKSALADALHISPPAVGQWVNETRPIPADKCVAIEQLVNGVVSRCELYGDGYERIWPELARQVTTDRTVA